MNDGFFQMLKNEFSGYFALKLSHVLSPPNLINSTKLSPHEWLVALLGCILYSKKHTEIQKNIISVLLFLLRKKSSHLKFSQNL